MPPAEHVGRGIAKEQSMRWIGLLFALLVNAVPLYGVYRLGWSASTVVALYWAENLALAVFTCARIWLHRKLTRKRGHWRGGTIGVKVNDKLVTGGLLTEYALLAFPFTLVHGIFVVALVALGASNHSDSAAWQFSRVQFEQGLQWILAALVLEFVIDAATMRSRSFAWLKAYVGRRTGRVLIMHFVIIFGMFGMMAMQSPFAMLYVLIGFKTLWDVFASDAAADPRSLPTEPPAWVLATAARLGKDGGGAKKARADWQRSREQQIRAAVEDEETQPA
jgi:hypothetical protein